MSSRSSRSPRVTQPASGPKNEDFESTLPRSSKFVHCEMEQLDLNEWLRSNEENLGLHSSKITGTEPITRGECGDCGFRGREITMHVDFLEAKLREETEARTRLTLATAECKKQSLVKDREIEILKLENREMRSECDNIRDQLEVTSKHLDAMELSFNDVHEKYERAKQTIHLMHQNVVTLKESLAEHNLCIGKKHEQFLMLKEHAVERMDFANSQLDLIERKYSLETSKLRAALREAELGARSLSDQLEQRNRDNAELTSICDGLIARMDTRKNIGTDNKSMCQE